jgi:hypothetical protein
MDGTRSLSLLIKAHTDLTIIYEAMARLTHELTELTQEFDKQATMSGKPSQN